MRPAFFEIVLANLLVLSATCFGADISGYEKTCLDLGFKQRSPAYGECVLELEKRGSAGEKLAERQRMEQQQQQNRQRAAEINQRGDGTPDHQTCYKFGLIPSTPQYSDCRLKLTIAKREADQRQAAFESERRRYEEEKMRNDAQLKLMEDVANSQRIQAQKGTPQDPNYWFDKAKCFSTGRIDC
jgi:hypothetical protein